MKRLHVFVMLMMACFWVLSGSVQAQNPYCIGNLVWNDLNKNGVQDPGEPGLPDITVTLFAVLGTNPGTISTSDLLSASEVVKSTKTDLNGNYSFGNLPAGYYVVMVGFGHELDGWAASPMMQGTSDEKDSDIFPYLFITPLIELEPMGQTPNDRLGIDAGLFQIQDCDLVTIGDMVFNDCNHNGIMDCDEKGIAGVIVKLYSCDVRPQNGVSLYSPSCIPQYGCGWLVQQTVTDLNGHYEFGKVLPGQYCVEVCLPEGFKVIPRPGCPDACNPVIPTNHTGCMMFTACTKNMDIDFAVCHNGCDLAAIGDLVWEDPNEDGIQNMGETGFPGVKVILYRYCCNETPAGAISTTQACDPIEVASLTTDANGKYLFSNLIPGYYQIKVKAPFGYSASPMDQNVDAAGPNEQELKYDSDIDQTTFRTKWIALFGENMDIDAGLYFDERLVSCINGFVWKDADEDGVRDEREPAMAGITLKLYQCTSPDCGKDPCGDKLLATTKTDKNGYYEFLRLDPDPKKTYCVKIDLPSCYLLTKQVPVPVIAPTVAVVDYYSDFNPSTKHTACLGLTAGQCVSNVDAGLIYSEPVPGTIGDIVWEDANKNGIQDCGEKGIPGVTVELHKCDGGALVACTTTNAEGKYLFTNVPAEVTYYVKFVLPGAFQFTAQNAGEDDAVDSDPCPEKGITANFTLGNGQSTLLIDAGMFRANCTVSDIVWVDKNYNGKMDADESGMAGVDVELYACEDETMVQSVKTDATGRYTFNNVLGGSYYMKINIPAGYVLGTFEDNAANANFVVGQTACFDVTKEGIDMKIPLVTSVESRTGIPTAFEMDQNFPNPFNPSTTIRFGIPEAGIYTLKVYNMLGQEVATLLNGELSAGYKDVVFDASKLTSGVYIYRLTGTNVVITKKMMLNK